MPSSALQGAIGAVCMFTKVSGAYLSLARVCALNEGKDEHEKAAVVAA